MKINVAIFAIVILFEFIGLAPAQDFQGKAYYFSKSSLELGAWGARMSEAQKKQEIESNSNMTQNEGYN